MFTGEPTASRDVVALRSMNTPLPLFEPKHFVEAFVAASYKNSALRESPCIDLWCANQVQTPFMTYQQVGSLMYWMVFQAMRDDRPHTQRKVTLGVSSSPTITAPSMSPLQRAAASNWPVQYCGFGERATLLQRALHRAKEIAPTAQIVVTVREENRDRMGACPLVHSPGAAFRFGYPNSVLVDDGGCAAVDRGRFDIARSDYSAGAALCGR